MANLGPQPSTGYTSDGVTTILWGTDGYLQSPFPSGGIGTGGQVGFYIVVSIDETQKRDIDYGENGTGIECRRTFLTHGKVWNITVEDDVTMTPPALNSQWSIVDLLGSNSGSTGGSGKANAKTGVVIDNGYRAARKTPGLRVITLENLTLVDPQP